MAEAIETIRAGRSIVVLARRPEPAADVHKGLLDALDLLGSLEDVAGTNERR